MCDVIADEYSMASEIGEPTRGGSSSSRSGTYLTPVRQQKPAAATGSGTAATFGSMLGKKVSARRVCACAWRVVQCIQAVRTYVCV